MFKKIISLCAVALIAATSAHASSLLPGSTVAASTLGFGGTQVWFVGGTLNTGTGLANYSASAYSDPTNALCSGCLDFVYQLDTQSAGSVSSFSVSNFGGFLLNVGYSGSAFAPTTVSSSANGSVVTFNFGSTGIPGATLSDYLVIQTNTKSFLTLGNVGLTSATGFSSTAAGIEPVPEPSTLLLMGSGIFGLAGAIKRKMIA